MAVQVRLGTLSCLLSLASGSLACTRPIGSTVAQQQPPPEVNAAAEAEAEERRAKRRAMAPMTMSEYERVESKVRQEFDPSTGRMRYVGLSHWIK